MSENTASAKAQEQEKTAGKPRREGSKKQGKNDPSFNMDELRELAELVHEHGFTDFEFENENIRVRLSKMTAAPVLQAAPSYAPAPATAPVAAPASRSEGEAASSVSTEIEEDLFKITSPIVGTFYSAAGPDKDPYVKVGSKVTPETVVCIVEAMKLMNEIQAETTGEIAKVYVENGQPVEYGQPLFGVRQ